MTGPIADAGLLVRFRAVEPKIAWRPVIEAPGGPPRSLRIAHLHDEDARIEKVEGSGWVAYRTDSGPVGALVLVLEADRRGVPTRLRAHEANALPGFAMGALEAVWGDDGSSDERRLPISDVIGLARYALA